MLSFSAYLGRFSKASQPSSVLMSITKRQRTSDCSIRPKVSPIRSMRIISHSDRMFFYGVSGEVGIRNAAVAGLHHGAPHERHADAADQGRIS